MSEMRIKTASPEHLSLLRMPKTNQHLYTNNNTPPLVFPFHFSHSAPQTAHDTLPGNGPRIHAWAHDALLYPTPLSSHTHTHIGQTRPHACTLPFPVQLGAVCLVRAGSRALPHYVRCTHHHQHHHKHHSHCLPPATHTTHPHTTHKQQ